MVQIGSLGYLCHVPVQQQLLPEVAVQLGLVVECNLLPERVVIGEQLALLRMVAVPVPEPLDCGARERLALLGHELAVAVSVLPGPSLGLAVVELMALHLQPELGVG